MSERRRLAFKTSDDDKNESVVGYGNGETNNSKKRELLAEAKDGFSVFRFLVRVPKRANHPESGRLGQHV